MSRLGKKDGRYQSFGNRLRGLAVFFGATAIFISCAHVEASDLKQADVIGCWRKQILPSGDPPQVRAIDSLCFRPDKKVYRISIGGGSGGDEILEWDLLNGFYLPIDRQECTASTQVTKGNKVMYLSRCVYTGVWIKTCDTLNADGTGCKK